MQTRAFAVLQICVVMVTALRPACHVQIERRQFLSGAAVAVALPPTLAFAVAGDDLPPDALKTLMMNAAPLQLAADAYMFGLGDAAADPKAWDALPRQITPGAKAAERALFTPLNSLSLAFLDDELTARIASFGQAARALAQEASAAKGSDTRLVTPKAIGGVVKAHATGATELQRVFARVNVLTQGAADPPPPRLVASATTRDKDRYMRYVGATARCQQAGGPMVSVQAGGLTCGDDLLGQYLASQASPL